MPAKQSRGRQERSAERRAAIIAAGLEEFVARGFTATRLDDIARRAGVGKGTIYLHFKDKEVLFQELVRSAIVPLVGRLEVPVIPGMSARATLDAFIEVFAREMVASNRGDIVRLLISEGGRFPSLAEFYFNEVVSRGLAGIRAIVKHGISRGEIRNDVFVRFPQLVVAPAILSLVWQNLFDKHHPLDIRLMLRSYLDVIFDGGKS